MKEGDISSLIRYGTAGTVLPFCEKITSLGNDKRKMMGKRKNIREIKENKTQNKGNRNDE